MSEPLWTSTLAIAPLRNVPSLGYDVAHAQAREIKRHDPDRIKATEGWDADVQQAFRDVFGPSWLWHGRPGESGFMGCDTRHWLVVSRWRFIDMAADPIRGSNDGRDVFGRVLRAKGTRRELEDYVVHTNNLPTIKAPHLVPRARDEQLEAAENMELRAAGRSRPQSWDGDFNNVRALTKPDLVRRGPADWHGRDERILHSEMHHGRYQRLTASRATPYSLRRGDHPLLIVVQRGWAA